MKKEIKIVIADDHPLFRAGLKQTLEAEQNFKVVGEAENGKDAIEMINSKNPDVALLDIRMPGLNGIEILEKLYEEKTNTKVILLTMYKNENYFYQAISLGAKGYILKETAVNELIEAVNIVADSGTFISEALTHFITAAKKTDEDSQQIINSINSLTETEKKILHLISQWKTNNEIAEELFVSPRTVGNHRTHISLKLNLHGTHSLVRFSIENQDIF